MDYNLTDIGAERAVLAGLFQYGIDAYVEVADVVTASSFGHENNQVLYACVQHVVEKNSEVDLPSILSAASTLNHAERVENETELKYIKSLFDFPVNQSNIFNFAVQVKKFEFARNIKKLTLKIHKDMDSVNGTESIDGLSSRR